MPLRSEAVTDCPDRQVTAIHYAYSIEQTQQLKDSARQQQATLNDLLASFVFQACDSMRRAQNGYRAQQWLRMMVPMSLRGPESAGLSACNVVACVFLDRTGPQIQDHAWLLASIHREMELIKRNRLGFLFILSLWIKKIMRFRSRRRGLGVPPVKRCHTSIVFSNMGRIFEQTELPKTVDGRLQAGSICLEACQILAPVADLMSIAITAYQYAGRVTLSLRYDSHTISQADAKRLLRLIVESSFVLTGPSVVRSPTESLRA